MGLPMSARSRQSRPKHTSMLVPISLKRGIFSMGSANSRNQEKGVVFIFNFGKLNSHSLIIQGDDITYIYKKSILDTDVLYNSLLYFFHLTKIDANLMAHV